MTWASLALWALTLLAGAVAVGLVRCDLRLWERLALSVVVGVVATSVVGLGLGLVAGLNAATAFLAPALLIVVASLGAWRRGGPRPGEVWRGSLDDARVRAGAAHGRETWAALGLTAGALVGFGVVFAHTLYEQDGSIVAGFPTVWADWSLHSTLASSFSVAHNLPPQNPIFSGTSLSYPFLPDFHSAMLQSTGAAIGASLATPGVLLGTAIVVLIAALAKRLCNSLAVGALAALLCVLGGSLGFTGVWWDACHAAGHADADCRPLTAIAHPATAMAIVGRIPTVVANQPRAYDNLQNDSSVAVGNVQWYTPLLAWWLPQRTFLYGFAVGLAVLLLVVAARRAPPGTRSPFLLAGLLAGTLPLIHVHSLFALAIVLPFLFLQDRRREWRWLVIPALVLALPRLVQVAQAGRGVPQVCAAGAVGGTGTGTAFPFLEPGWLWPTSGQFDAVACAVPGRYDASLAGVVRAVPAVLRTVVDPGFWWFWVFNNGAVVVIAVVVTAVALLRLWPQRRIHGWSQRLQAWLTAAVPDDLLRFCLPFLAIFAVSNVVVFQTWDWDNTKLLAYWYLGGALLTAAVLVRLFRSGLGRALLGTLLLVSLLAAAGLNLSRYARDHQIPFAWATPEQRALAAAVDANTPKRAVFLTAGDPTDPILTLAGRSAVSGYAGWLYSYGIDTGMRPEDSATILAGCDSVPSGCRVAELLHRYHIDYVEMCFDTRPQCAGAAWFGRTYHAVARSSSVSVYDVRRP
ncbi:MAG TPA: hypothetical protein VI316_05505 [Candidatus Dormibacteraeota bacterium]